MPNPAASPPADPQVLTRFQEGLARAAALPGLAPAGPALWARFAVYYQGLTRLPRRLRRALQRRWRRSLGALALLCALGQAPAVAGTILVDGTTCTLVDAITAANNDVAAGGCTAGSGADTTLLSPFFETNPPLTTVNNNTYGATGLPVITSELTISGFGSTITRDSGAPPFRVLAIGATGNLTLEGTTVSGGVASGDFEGGGGIFNRGTLSESYSTVSGNLAASGRGGGISGSFGSGPITVTNSTVSGNTAGGFGGGISGNAMTLTHSTVSGNSAELGGGIEGGPLTLIDSTVSGNTAGSGGGVYMSGGGLTLTDSTVSGNTAESDGGGISLNNGTTTLTASTVEGNTARYDGGGIYNFFSNGSTLTLTNSTVSGNTAGTSGGGMSNGDLLTLNNSTVSGNAAADRGGAVENTGTATFTNSTVTGNASGRVGRRPVQHRHLDARPEPALGQYGARQRAGGVQRRGPGWRRHSVVEPQPADQDLRLDYPYCS